MWSMSKTYGMAGWRIGFVLGNSEIVERINLFNDHTPRRDLRPAPARLPIAALEGPQDLGRRTGRRPTRLAVTGSRLLCRSRSSARARSSSGCGFRRV